MPNSVYIHIPFCKSKCKYCSFTSFMQPEYINDYINALIKEIQSNYKGEYIKTLYFGGGTPSLISVADIKKILQNFKFAPNCEITLELNPDDADFEYLKILNNLGINRLSIGSQTFDDNILKIAGRRHSSKDIINTVILAKKAGFENISVDLIYGLPTQTLKGIEKDLIKFKNLEIQHISTYGLKIENTSYWGLHLPENLPDDDTQADMYELINAQLKESNFCRYEISNFAIKGFESKHNLNYWNNNEYYGFGIAAHGYINQTRYSNLNILNEYLKNPLRKENVHYVTKKEKLEEEIFLGLRKTAGININNININYNIDFVTKYKKILTKYSKFFTETAEGYALNQNGILISNLILAEFIE